MSTTISTTAESVCCVRRCSSLLFDRSFDMSDTVLVAVLKVISTAVHKLHEQPSASSNRKHEQSWTSCKVSWRVPLNSCTLRAMECCFCCLPAARALGLLPPASQLAAPEKVDRTRAPPVPLSPCSQTLSERAVRVYVGAKEDPKRERRHQSALARACNDMVV